MSLISHLHVYFYYLNLMLTDIRNKNLIYLLASIMYPYTLFNTLLKLMTGSYFTILQVVFEVLLPDAKLYPFTLQLLNLIHDLMSGWPS